MTDQSNVMLLGRLEQSAETTRNQLKTLFESNERRKAENVEIIRQTDENRHHVEEVENALAGQTKIMEEIGEGNREILAKIAVLESEVAAIKNAPRLDIGLTFQKLLQPKSLMSLAVIWLSIAVISVAFLNPAALPGLMKSIGGVAK